MVRYVIPLQFLAVAIVICAPPQTIRSLRLASRDRLYEEPSEQDIRAAEKLFHLLLKKEHDRAALDPLLQSLRCELVELTQNGEQFLVVKEKEAHRNGWGLYAFRRNASDAMVLDAPHSGDDAQTGMLAELFFLESRAAAVAWSTAPRSTPTKDGRKEADLPHLPDGILHAFHRAFVAAHPQGVAIQLHGFGDSGRSISAGIIISGGSESPPDWLLKTAGSLAEKMPLPVAVYPRDVKELGGATNAHARLFRAAGHRGFAHVEMSSKMRVALKRKPDLRQAFLRCFPGKQP